MTNISDVRIVENMLKTFSIRSNYPSSLDCTINGCLRILGKIIFPKECRLACQLRKISKTKGLNIIQPSIKLNLNSTIGINYFIEFDAFTIGKNLIFSLRLVFIITK